MDKNQFIQSLEDLIEADPGSLTEQSVLADTAGWDSMAIMGFIAFADEELGAAPAPAALKTCVTVADLMTLVGL
jgi:acyl carrier protein